MRADFRMKSALLAVALSLGGGVALAQKPEKPVNTGQMPNSREAVKAEARQVPHNTDNTNVPAAAGEASTMTDGQPNMQRAPGAERSRAEVSQQARHQRPRFGETGEKIAVPTNPPGTKGTPQ